MHNERHLANDQNALVFNKKEIKEVINNVYIKRVDANGNIYKISKDNVNDGTLVGFNKNYVKKKLLGLDKNYQGGYIFNGQLMNYETMVKCINTFLKRYDIEETHILKLTEEERLNFFLDLKRTDVEF